MSAKIGLLSEVARVARASNLGSATMDHRKVDGINGPLIRGPQIDLAFASELEVEDLNGENLQAIAAEIGIESALKIANLFGGSRFNFPLKPHKNHPVWMLGEDVSSILMKMFAPARFDIPRQALSNEKLARLVRARLKLGQTERRIALELNLSYRTIERINAARRSTKELARVRRDSDAHLTGVADYAR